MRRTSRGPRRRARAIEEEGVAGRVLARHVLTSVLDPQLDRFQALAVQGHHAFLSPLSQHPHQPAREIDAVEIEVTELRDAKSRAVEQLAHRPVEHGPLVLAPVIVQEVVQLLAHHDLGQVMGGLGRQQARRGVALDVAPLQEARRSSCAARLAGEELSFVRRRGWSCRPSSREDPSS